MGFEFNRPKNHALLVCKEQPELEKLKALLIDLGISRVTAVRSSAEALEAIYVEYPNVFITEKNIQGRLSGVALVATVAKKRIPSILLVDNQEKSVLQVEPANDNIHLLQKPVDDMKLQEALQTLASRSVFRREEEQTAPDQFFIRVNNRLQRIQVSAIEWVESEGNYCVFHYRNKRFALKISLRKVINELEDYPLVQIHKKYIVHLAKIDTIDISEGKVYLKDEVLPIGRRYRQSFLDRLHWIK